MEIKQILHGPAIRTPDGTRRIMRDVLLALIPAWLGGIFFFGISSLGIVVLSTFTAIGVEALILRYPLKFPDIFGDGSAAVTGLLLGLCLPSTVPWWIPIIGSVCAITLGKLVFGGLGSNIFNPALVGRAILALGFTAHMVKYAAPFDTVTRATPLVALSKFDWALVWGNVGGAIGETSVIAILVGGLYLVYRGHIGWRIPVGYLGTSFLAAWLWGLDPWMAVTAGGLLFAAVFMATDMVTSPVTPLGRLVFGCGCGFLTMFIREFTAFPEGVTFAVLIMNATVPLLDRFTMPVVFGIGKPREQRIRTTIAAAVILLAGIGVLAVVNILVPPHKMIVAEGVYLPLTETLGSSDYQVATIDDKVYYYTGAMEAPARVAFTGSHQGYHAPIYFYVVVDAKGTILHLQILSHNDDPGLGSLVTRDTFLQQFIGLGPTDDLSLGADIMGVTGATISSRAVISGVNSELHKFMAAFYGVEEAPAIAGWLDGVYLGKANSFGGALEVEVRVADGKIAQVTILKHQDTPGICDEAHLLMPERIVAANNWEVDVVTRATVSSEGIMAAVKAALAAAVPKEPDSLKPGIAEGLPDGTYLGTGSGHDGPIELEIIIAAGKITDITIVRQNETSFAAAQALSTLAAGVIENQALVDIFTGATRSSEGFLEAIVDGIGLEGVR